jgi:DNA-binding NarL/FixJ family response regulator
MDYSTPHIVILTEHSVRAKSLADMIQTVSKHFKTVSTIAPGDLKSYTRLKSKPIFILDLMGCHQPSQQIIKNLKSELSDAKIIALHMYRNKSLIAPILNEGIDGYLYYEPSRSELAKALENVHSGKTYTPTYADG